MRVGPLLSLFACLSLAPSLALASASAKKGKKGKQAKAVDAKPEPESEPAPEPDEVSEPEPEPEPEPDPEPDEVDADDESSASAEGSIAAGEVSSSSARGGKNPAAAMKGRFGVGGIRTVSGLNGLVVQGYLTDRLTLGAVAGFATFSHRENNDEGEFKDVNTVGLIGGGPQLFYWPYQGSRNNQVYADFGVGGRALVYVGLTGINRDRPEDATTLDIPVEIDIEVPLAAPVWIGQRVAITPEFGFVARIIPGSREADQNGDADSNPGTGVAQRLGAQNGPGVGFELGNTSAGMFIGLSIGYFFGQIGS